MNLKIRMAASDDASVIADFNYNMAEETENILLDKPLLLEGVKAVLNDDQKGFYILAETDNKAVACLMITREWSDWRNAWWWWFQSVYVAKPYRKHKIFSKMYNYIEEFGKKENIAGLRLYVDEHNRAAQSVYTSLGMQQSNYYMFETEKEV